MFLSTVSPDISMFVYKHSLDGLGVYVQNKKTKKSLFLRHMPKDWKSNSIHHLAYTWDGAGNSVLYLDGKMVNRGFVEFSDVDMKYFIVGPTGRFGSAGQSAISYLRFYNRPLTSREVIVVAGELIPELKKKGLEIVQETVMAASPWFKNRPKLGLDALDGNYVPYPFENVAAKGSDLSVWQRKYSFGGKGLLDQVNVKNENLLRKSVVNAENGKAVAIKNNTVTLPIKRNDFGVLIIK